jgi:hypothetical protein
VFRILNQNTLQPLSHSLSQIVAKGAKWGKTYKYLESEESLYFTECFSQSSRFQRVAKMACFGFTVCPVWPLRYLSPSTYANWPDSLGNISTTVAQKGSADNAKDQIEQVIMAADCSAPIRHGKVAFRIACMIQMTDGDLVLRVHRPQALAGHCSGRPKSVTSTL